MGNSGERHPDQRASQPCPALQYFSSRFSRIYRMVCLPSLPYTWTLKVSKYPSHPCFQHTTEPILTEPNCHRRP